MAEDNGAPVTKSHERVSSARSLRTRLDEFNRLTDGGSIIGFHEAGSRYDAYWR